MHEWITPPLFLAAPPPCRGILDSKGAAPD
jgi:hypothetical protein